MIHLGDITMISGYDAPTVDVVIGGSPCQDLSVAGKRAGLAGERSGLYMEQIRIIREMRKKDGLHSGRTGEFVRPRYMVWENVPGAFSSNKGKDFAAVLEEAIRVAEPEAPDVPVPEKGWNHSGCLMGDRWSVAWRILDAQFWGVPQRRRRIALVADFGGQSAPEILFVRKSMSGDSEPGEPKRKETAGDVGNSTAYTMQVRCGCPGGGKEALIQTDKSACLSTSNIQTLFQPIMLENHPADSRVTIEKDGTCQTLTSRMGTGGGNVPMLMEPVCYNGSNITSKLNKTNPQPGDPCHTLANDSRNYVVEPVCIGNGQSNQSAGTIAGALNCMHDQQAVVTAGINFRAGQEYAEINGTLQAKSTGGWNLNDNNAIRQGMVVRRLTPLECERLQGFPDGWTDIGEWVDSKGKKHRPADSPRYKALGNSIAIPPWKWVLKRICACYERDATMASLFDGIGGFPLIWEQLNGKGTCIWASEIEEFPMAVTRLRFGGGTK